MVCIHEIIPESFILHRILYLISASRDADDDGIIRLSLTVVSFNSKHGVPCPLIDISSFGKNSLIWTNKSHFFYHPSVHVYVFLFPDHKNFSDAWKNCKNIKKEKINIHWKTYLLCSSLRWPSAKTEDHVFLLGNSYLCSRPLTTVFLWERK